GEIPAAGARVKKGSTVELRVSRGPGTVVVPNAVGLAEATARDRLVAAGFKVTETRVFNQEKTGTVVAQSPAAGRKIGKGATVRATQVCLRMLGSDHRSVQGEHLHFRRRPAQELCHE